MHSKSLNTTPKQTVKGEFNSSFLEDGIMFPSQMLKTYSQNECKHQLLVIEQMQWTKMAVVSTAQQ